MKQQSITTSIFVILSVIAILTLALAAVPAPAQNTVPPTAREALKSPEYANRLAARRATNQPLAFRLPITPTPPQGLVLYDNGPVNGNTDAWTINFGYVVSDSFKVAAYPLRPAELTGAKFAMWLFPGDTLTSAQLSITRAENGGTSYFNETVNFTQGGCVTNNYGYNVCQETTSFDDGYGGPVLIFNEGTYWLNLQNASVPSGDPVYWDENSGPSSASENSVGTIPSESFEIDGGEPQCISPIVNYPSNRTGCRNTPNGRGQQYLREVFHMQADFSDKLGLCEYRQYIWGKLSKNGADVSQNLSRPPHPVLLDPIKPQEDGTDEPTGNEHYGHRVPGTNESNDTYTSPDRAHGNIYEGSDDPQWTYTPTPGKVVGLDFHFKGEIIDTHSGLPVAGTQRFWNVKCDSASTPPDRDEIGIGPGGLPMHACRSGKLRFQQS